MLLLIPLLLACHDDSERLKPCECGDNEQADRETGGRPDSTASMETGDTSTTGEGPETITVTCTSRNTEVDLGITPGEPPPRFAVWGHADPTIEWEEFGRAPGWVLINDLKFTEEGLAIIPCDADSYWVEGVGDVGGYVYSPFTVYIWR